METLVVVNVDWLEMGIAFRVTLTELSPMWTPRVPMTFSLENVQ